MKRILLGMALLVCFQNLSAQHTVSGIVSDVIDKTRLLDDVLVYIPEFGRTDFSKEGGTYILRNIGIGTVHIQFTKRGFKTILKTINTTDSATVINVEMQPWGNSFEEVTFISGLSAFKENSPYSVDVISNEKLNRSGSIKHLYALANEPGIDMITRGQISMPVIRGLSFNHLLMIQSGSRIENQTLDELHDYELIDDGTESVEIIKGPAALIYGENAMGGVMIFRDDKLPPAGTINGDYNLSYHSNTFGFNSSLGIKGTSNNGLYYSVRLGGMTHANYLQGEGTEIQKNTEIKKYAYNSGFNSGNVKGIIGISKKWGQSKLTVSFRDNETEIVESKTDSTIATMEDYDARNRKTTSPYVEQSTLLISSENIILLKKSQAGINVSWQSQDPGSSIKMDALNYNLHYISDVTKKFGFDAGVQGYISSKGNNNSLTVPKSDVLNTGIYVLLRYDMEKFNFLAGARYDIKNVSTQFSELDGDYNLANGSAGLAFHPFQSLTFKLNGSTGFNVPVDENGFFHRSFYGYVSSTQKLDVEKNYEGDFGISWETASITLSANAFYNKIMNYIYPDSLSYDIYSNEKYYQYSQADAIIKGGEAKIDFHPRVVKWLSASAAYGTSKGEFEKSKFDLPFMPADKFTAALRFQFGKINYLMLPYIEIGMRNYMKQDKVYTYEMPSAGYTLLDIHLGGSFKWGQQKFDISLSINNIVDQNYYSHLSLIKDAQPVPVRDMGRNVAIQFRLPFGIRKPN